MKKIADNWFIRYKLYHIPFWCLYHYLWWTVAVANPFKAASSILFLPYSVKYLFYVLFEAAAAYFNLYYLMPHFFKKGSYLQYFSLVGGVIILSALCIVSGYYISSSVTGRSLRELYGNGSNCFYYFLGFALPSSFASMTLAMTIKLLKNRVMEERRQEQLEKEKAETELKFLKQQFNPHFLFNSINSIFILIRKNPEKATAALAKFSELLRHQLYECNDLQIPLEREIGYLENFIELEKLRQNERLKVTFQMDADTGLLAIAPFILMTFVENAFKHVAKEIDTESRLLIRLSVKDQCLSFAVGNTKGPLPSAKTGGIGLKNVRRRLELIYPERYRLDIDDKDDWYEVRLQIELNELVNVPLVEIAY